MDNYIPFVFFYDDAGLVVTTKSKNGYQYGAWWLPAQYSVVTGAGPGGYRSGSSW